jgi:hypothetical protein
MISKAEVLLKGLPLFISPNRWVSIFLGHHKGFILTLTLLKQKLWAT